MDNDVNLMMIVGVMLLEPAVAYEALCERVADKLLKYERFRQKVVHDAVGASWVDDEDFDLRRHVRRETLAPAPGQTPEQALQLRCAELATTPLDPDHPLWSFHLVERYEGGSAMQWWMRTSIALISVTLSLTDGGSDPPKRRRRIDDEHHDAYDGDWLAKAVLEPLTDIAVKAIEMYGSGVARSLETLAHPQQLADLESGLRMARVGYQVASDVAALALLQDDSPTQLKGRGSGRKRVAWNQPLPLAEVKAVGRALGCSVNDLLLACVAGAIGEYLRERGEDPAGKEIRAMVPVNLRPLEEAWRLGNRFGLAPLVLPIGIDNPIERVFAVRRRMSELKGSYQPLLAFAVLSTAGLMIKPVQDAILNLFAKKATAVMTNVPGPAQPLKLLGSTIRQNIFWVPASGDIGLGVSILSYAGGVQFGLIADDALCPEPQAIIDRFGPEFEKMLLLTLMLPWGEET
jgi:diacylglycerol O-acyltransferase / wax synthase